MRPYKHPLLFLGLILVWLVYGCVSTIVVERQTATVIPVVSPLPSTSTLESSTLLTMTSSTGDAATTPTIIPTLSLANARTRFEELLAVNGNCRLPCLWGLTPGESTYDDALSVLSPLISTSDFEYLDSNKQSGGIGLVYPVENLEIHVSILFLVSQDNVTINRIAFDVETLKRTVDGFLEVFDLPFPSESYFTLSDILNEYRQPESVWLSTQSAVSSRDTTSGGFELLLLYPDQGIFAKYTTKMQMVDGNVRGCFLSSHVSFDLQPSGQRESFLRTLDTYFWSQYAPNRFKPLGEVTGFTPEKFYEHFRFSTNNCLDTPANLWPKPD